MKQRPLLISALSVVLFGAFSQNAGAQTHTIPDTSQMKYNEISSAMKLYVYPSKKQSQQKQKQDEFECYKWAMEQSGIDPLNMPQAKAAPVQTGPDGTVVHTAGKSAVVGTAVGAIAGDAGKGAAIGAVVGGAAGIRKKRVMNANKKQQAEADAAQQNQATADSFKKAFSVCIEGKGYTVK